MFATLFSVVLSTSSVITDEPIPVQRDPKPRVSLGVAGAYNIQADYFYIWGHAPGSGRHAARLALDASF